MELLRKNSFHALTLIEVLVVVVVIGLLACFLSPSFRKAKERAKRISCVSNLEAIGITFKIWAGDHHGEYPMQASITNGGAMELVETNPFSFFQVMSNEFGNYRAKVLVCPADVQRSPATNFTTDFNHSKISYFAGLDASDSMPQMFLADDRNLATNGVAVGPGILVLATNQILGWTEEIHKGFGNIALADGSVQAFTREQLNMASQNSGAATNRLAMP
jgi:prepilin-type N-terminal cleavage/methylation domain-containing protein/prepilin-type processing-associated H-X9-DG protein